MATPADLKAELGNLETLKKQQYELAIRDGSIAACATVARTFGIKPTWAYGPKYEWTEGRVRVFVDDYGGYMTVLVDGEKVCSTHFCDHLFVPGEWIKAIKRRLPEAVQKINDAECRRLRTEIAVLRHELGLPEATNG